MKILQLMVLGLFFFSFGCACFSSASYAAVATLFSDDFEDGDLADWNINARYLSFPGSIVDVVDRPSDSKWGHLYNGTIGWDAYSYTRFGRLFDYSPGLQFEFDMQVDIKDNTDRAYAAGGVYFDFLNASDVSIGYVGLMASSNANDFLFDPSLVQIATGRIRHYALDVKDMIAHAGITSPGFVDKIDMYFMTDGTWDTSVSPFQASAELWVDDVKVGVTPEPLSTVLFLTGGGTLVMFGKGKRKIKT